MKRELLDNGNIWQKSDGRWIGMVRYKDEYPRIPCLDMIADESKNIPVHEKAFGTDGHSTQH